MEIKYVTLENRLLASSIDMILIVLILNTLHFDIIDNIIWKIFTGYNMQEAENICLRAFDARSLTNNSGLNLGDYFSIAFRCGALQSIVISSFIVCSIIFLYHYLFWHFKSATPGKMIMRSKIVKSENLEKPSDAQFFIRFISYFLMLPVVVIVIYLIFMIFEHNLKSIEPGLIPLFVFFTFSINWIVIKFSSKNQALHDKISKTVVISNKK